LLFFCLHNGVSYFCIVTSYLPAFCHCVV
jgi:hypothetical protein